MAEPSGLPLLFQTFSAFQRTEALKAAIELDVFTAIAEGHDTPAAIATRCRAAERGVRILCDGLVAAGLLHKEGARYALDPETAPLLDRRSPIYIGCAADFLASSMVRQSFATLADAVRRGGTAIGEQGSTAPEHPMWVEFANAMAPVATFSAELLAVLLDASAGKPWKVLDIAAGHGMFGITLARHNPHAQVTALDWPNVLTVATANARKAGVTDRFRTIAGDAFTVDYDGGYDFVLLTNILHHFDPAGCEKLLGRVHAALAPGGRAVTLEFVPDASRVTPVEAASFALVMLAMTPGGDAYTFAEYEPMFRRAGFAKSELHELTPSMQRVIISHKA
jgi:ubiquinone/menaquinone biosynthesis C-methylase UbiE